MTDHPHAPPPPRILFVDDEAAILDGLRNVFHSRRRRWDMHFSCGGAQAIEQLERGPVNVVVTDMRMPDMDGLALLRRVQQRWPLAARIVLSGYADLGAVTQASAVAHQYLLKPCDPEVLGTTIERALELQTLLCSEALRDMVGRLGSLPAGPSTYQKLSVAMADPAVEVRKLARIVEADVAIAGRVLHFVNSAYFGLVRSVSSIEEAIVLLGISTLRSLALTIEIFSAFPGAQRSPGTLEIEERHALLTARIARRITGDPASAETAFAAGLLHDCGKLVLLDRMSVAYADAQARAQAEGRPVHEAEKAALGANHAEVGGYLLGLWGLPHPIVEAVAFHHSEARLTRGTLDTVVAVGVADLLARAAVRDVATDLGGAAVPCLGQLAETHRASWLACARQEAAKLGYEADRA